MGKRIGHGLLYLALLLLTAWAVLALYFDVRIAWLRWPAICPLPCRGRLGCLPFLPLLAAR
jgi:hypothetical protein